MGSQELFCLRWSNHQTNMLSVFDRLLQSQALVDVTLACEGLSFRAHKMVLSACSPYFQSLFMENPCKHPIVILNDIKYSDLRALLDFMYKGEVNVNQDQLSGLIKTAEVLKVKGLTEIVSANTTEDETKISMDVNHPLPKRKRTRHQSRNPQPNDETHVISSKKTSNDAGNSTVIQGSPEMIESKVDIPEIGLEAENTSLMMTDEIQILNEETNEKTKPTEEPLTKLPTNNCLESDSNLEKPKSLTSSSFSTPKVNAMDLHSQNSDDFDIDPTSIQHPIEDSKLQLSTVYPVPQSLNVNLNIDQNSNNNCNINLKKGHPRILNEEEEEMIVRYVLDMARIGKLVTRKCVINYGNMLLRRHDRVPTGSIHCNPSKGLSNDWWKEFKKRHSKLPFCRHPASNT